MQENTVAFELSLEQRLLWASSADPAGAIAQIRLLLDGLVDVQRLKAVLEKLVERHEILRTTFQRRPGMRFPFQVVSDRAEVKWHDALPEPGNLDLERMPILHANLARLADNRQVLTIRVPALCADRASLLNLAVELAALYSNPDTTLPEVLQYADYGEWQKDFLSRGGQDFTEGKRYWDQQDWWNIPELVVPFARKSQRDRPFSAAIQKIPLDSKVIERLRELAPDVAPVLLAAWQALLFRLTHASHLVTGLAVPGRNHAELEAAVGLFSRTLPFRSDFEEDRSFADFVELTRQRKAKEEQWQDSFVPPQEANYDFSAGFSEQASYAASSAGGVKFSFYREDCFVHRFDLELRCRSADPDWGLELVHNRGRLWPDGAERIRQAFSTLLAGAAADSGARISRLPILSEEESRRIQVAFNRTEKPFSQDKCIHQLFEDQARRVPAHPALRCGERVLTFDELNKRANQVAHSLRKRGVGPDVPVGLCTERSTDMIAGLLAILKAGGCYLPLLHDQPNARLLHQISESGTRVVLTQAKLRDALPEANIEIMCLDGGDENFGQESTENPESKTTANHLAYVIYTSGSTGLPKGVAVRHASLVNYSQFICRLLKVNDHPGGLHFATVSTIGADLGNTCIFPALISGGCLHVMPYETAMAANLFADHLEKHPIDVLKITPSHLTALLSARPTRNVWPRQHLVLGGETLSWDLLGRIQATAPCAVINHYGPSEATVGCSTFPPKENDVSVWEPASVPIGRPIANTEIHIVDEYLRSVPAGVAGELCIGGAGLARGYLNQPQQTQERFVRNPFSSDATARLYRTGDAARFLPDGNIEFLGRIDHQVKIRGFRIEPAEIEATLKQHANVKETVVLPYDDASGEKRLAAYIVSTAVVSARDLRAFLSERVPDYMIPSQFVQVERLPLTANGKIDLQALSAARERSAGTSDEPAKAEPIKPRTAEEERIAAIWSEVLKQPCLDVHANFFMLGGHSLLATQIISRIRDAFQVQFPLHSFLQTPTIAEVAVKIGECPRVESGAEMDRLLEQLESLSDEEAERLLAEMERDGERARR